MLRKGARGGVTGGSSGRREGASAERLLSGEGKRYGRGRQQRYRLFPQISSLNQRANILSPPFLPAWSLAVVAAVGLLCPGVRDVAFDLCSHVEPS